MRSKSKFTVDFSKLATTLLPTCLRGSFLVALVKVLVTPLVYIQTIWETFYLQRWRDVHILPEVDVLEKYLNDYFGVTTIQIESPDVANVPGFYYEAEEGERTSFYKISEGQTAYYIGADYYVPSGVKIIIHIPKALISRTDEIDAIMAKYKPTGRTYTITTS